MERTPETKGLFHNSSRKKKGKIPKRKSAGAQLSDKKSEEINKSLDTVLSKPKTLRAGRKIANFLQVGNGAENL